VLTTCWPANLDAWKTLIFRLSLVSRWSQRSQVQILSHRRGNTRVSGDRSPFFVCSDIFCCGMCCRCCIRIAKLVIVEKAKSLW
jgi:hypothetical protein